MDEIVNLLHSEYNSHVALSGIYLTNSFTKTLKDRSVDAIAHLFSCQWKSQPGFLYQHITCLFIEQRKVYHLAYHRLSSPSSSAKQNSDDLCKTRFISNITDERLGNQQTISYDFTIKSVVQIIQWYLSVTHVLGILHHLFLFLRCVFMHKVNYSIT